MQLNKNQINRGHYKEITNLDIALYGALTVMFIGLSCSDDLYVGGYNKDLEHIDSSFYEKSRKINTGHE